MADGVINEDTKNNAPNSHTRVTQTVRRTAEKVGNMSLVNYFKELLSRPSPSGVNDEYLLIMRSYMQKHLTQVEAAEHRLHLTAFGVGMLAFLAGFGICWLAFVR